MLEQYLTFENLKIVAAAAIGFLGTKMYGFGGMKISSRRRAAAELAAKYKEMKLDTIGDILLDYSVGDYAGIAKNVVSSVHRVRENGLQDEFDNVLEKMLSAKLADPEFRASLKERLSL